MPTIDDIITDILVKEGGPKVTNDPLDAGGRTQYGISEASNPLAWLDGKVTEEEARAIYLQKYVIWPRFNLVPPSLQTQLIDYGVNSGPLIATMKLQTILGMDADGVIGPKTLAALSLADPKWVNNELVKARVEMICRICQKNPSQLKYLLGWARRALSFLK